MPNLRKADKRCMLYKQFFILKRIFYLILFYGCTSSDNTRDKQNNVSDSSISTNVEGIIHDISYGVHESQKFDIYLPSTRKQNKTTIFYVHGGAWYAGDKTEAIHWAKYFQELGYTFICLNYRLTHTKENYTHPTQLNDIDSSITYVLKKSIDWDIDKERCVIMGASAGGHLALLYAYKYNNFKRIKLAIALCSILNLTDEKLLNADLGDINGETMISWYIGDTKTNKLQYLLSASPLFNISQTSVPTVFLHGKEDEIVPYQQSVAAYNQLQRWKIPSELISLDSVDHDLLSINLTKQFNQIDSFIKTTLGNNSNK
jgi:acetyl esterase/lipase